MAGDTPESIRALAKRAEDKAWEFTPGTPTNRILEEAAPALERYAALLAAPSPAVAEALDCAIAVLETEGFDPEAQTIRELLARLSAEEGR